MLKFVSIYLISMFCSCFNQKAIFEIIIINPSYTPLICFIKNTTYVITLFLNQLTFYSWKQLKSATPFCTDFTHHIEVNISDLVCKSSMEVFLNNMNLLDYTKNDCPFPLIIKRSSVHNNSNALSDRKSLKRYILFNMTPPYLLLLKVRMF